MRQSVFLDQGYVQMIKLKAAVKKILLKPEVETKLVGYWVH